VLFALLDRALILATGCNIDSAPPGRSALHLGHDLDVFGFDLIKGAKQAVFDLANASRMAMRGRFGVAGGRVLRSLRALPMSADGATLDAIRAIEERAGVRSTFYVYARTDNPGRDGGLSRALLDPRYGLRRDDVLARKLRELLAGGWSVGLHAGAGAWRDAAALVEQKRALEAAIDAPVTKIRNHWLRFSLAETWHAQVEAGFTEDATLGFNDAVGFRAGLARPFRPFDPHRKEMLPILAVPVVAMDSTLFDYLLLPPDQAEARCQAVLAEAARYGGTPGLSWHVHGFSDILGWGASYERLLARTGRG
jgi:hypothetical protein